MLWGYFLIFISAASYGLIPIFALYAYDSGVNTTTLLFLRFGFAAILFFAYLFFKRESWRVTKKQLLVLILMGGILYMLQSSFYFSSVKYIPASLAALLLYLNPLFVAVLSFAINKEKMSKQILMAMVLSLFGISLVLGAPAGEINLIGIWLAVGAAVVYSIYILVGDRVMQHIPPLITCSYIALFSSFSFLIGGMATDAIHFNFGAIGWAMAVGVALFCSVIAMFTFFAGMKIIGPTKASILSMVEPLVTIILSTILFHEKMSTIQLLGGMLVLVGAALVVLAREKKQQEKSTFEPKIMEKIDTLSS